MLGTSGKTLLAFALGMLLLRAHAAAALDLDVTATVTGCGDGIVQSGEECDGSNFAGESCTTQGFSGGSLSCDFGCSIVTTACNGGGGGTGGPVPTPGPSSINFSGKAYPNSPVYILKDGQLAKTTTADPAGNFQTQLTNVSSGSYTFSLYAEDTVGTYSSSNLSALSNYQVAIGNGGTYNVNNIFIAPILAVENSAVIQPEPFVFYGRSYPGADIAITLNTPTPITVHVTADADGYYSYSLPSSSIPSGDYSTTAMAEFNHSFSTQSLPVSFGSTIITYMLGDFSENLRVNLVDFSIALYWYKQPLTDAFKVLEVRHGNGDGLLTLIDISIIAYYWTG